MLHVLRIVILLGLVVSVMGPGMAAQAQAGTSDISIVTTLNGSSFYDACYVIVNFSNEGCDENGDGQITFDDVPYGSYTVTQTRDLGSGRYVSDFTIYVSGASSSSGREIFSATVSGGGNSDGGVIGTSPKIAIYTTLNGSPFYDACYVLVGYSNEGCDENRDGRVMFDDIPWGTYTVTQTANLGSGRYVNDFTIEVRGNINSAGWESFSTSVVQPSGQTSGSSRVAGDIDIALITRDPEDGHLLTGTCYVLVGYSNEGCDENGDGQVTFDAIPEGTYTVRQTQTPAGYPTISDYEIMVGPMPVDGMGPGPSLPMGFVVRQAPDQNSPNSRNVSVVLVGSGGTEKFVGGICAEIVGASNVGCDDDLADGQIDFLDVPAGGPYELRFSNVPAGYRVMLDPNFDGVRVRADGSQPANVFVYVFVTVSSSSNSGMPASAWSRHWQQR